MLFKRGNKANLPTLTPGEPAFTLDTGELYVGSPMGNKKFANQESVDALNNQDVWHSPSLAQGWTNYANGFASFGYRKLSNGMVVFKGLVQSGTSSITIPVLTLPVGYRPLEKQMFITLTATNSVGRLDVDNAGKCYINVGTSAYFSFSGISFFAEQ